MRMQFVKLVTIACLVGAISAASHHQRRATVNNQVGFAASQLSPAVANSPDPKAQQAKLHYVEIGPSLKGDYKFGYDTGSGPAGQSFREETRLDDGTVKGAYGYIDANGKQRIVRYTAGKAGFVVDADQEAPGQSGSGARATEQAQQQPAPVHRPQPVAAPEHRAPIAQAAPQPAQPQFDAEPAEVPINRAAAQQSHLSAEQLHAQQLRQHELAQQAALAQQQQLAQQLQQQQQLQIQQQQAAAAARQQQAPAHAHHQHQQAQPQQQHHHHAGQQQQAQAAAAAHFPRGPHHQVVDPQNGHFFSSSSNDESLNELLMNQFRQLQQGAGFAQQQFPAPAQQAAAPAQAPQHFTAQAAPNFQAPANAPQVIDFNHQQQFRGARHVAHQQPIGPPQHQHLARQGQPGTPQSVLLALHQQQQHDAEVLAGLRAQQESQIAAAQRQQLAAPAAAAPPRHHHQSQAHHHQPAPVLGPQQAFAPQPIAPQQQQAQLATGPVAGAPQAVAPQQPEVFGPPVIDIRTLNYSIGQQTRVN